MSAGVGDTFASRAAVAATSFPTGRHVTSFAEPMYDNIALISRQRHTRSPATRELARLAEQTLLAR